MNKTVSINLAGIIFNIDDHAYSKLKNYLDTIEGYFTEADGKREIMSDIEARLAEMFQEKLSKGRMVVSLEDVNEAIGILGEPEAYLDGEESTAGTESKEEERTYSSDTNRTKRLFRDPDQRVFGGVCSGIGHYFGIDPVILRVIFVLSFIFFGTGVLVYLILWLVIPKAVTTADKLQMKGEPVTVDNIKRKVQEEADNVKKNFDRITKQTNEYGKRVSRDADNWFNRIVSFIGNVLTYFFRFLGKFIGLILVVACTFALGIFIISLATGVNSVFIDMNDDLFQGSAADIGMYLFTSIGDMRLFILSIILLVGMPLVFFILGGLKLVGLKASLKWPAIATIVLWWIGFGLAIYASLDTQDDFAKKNTYKQEILIPPTSMDTLYVGVNTESEWTKHSHGGSSDLLYLDDERMIISGVKLDIRKSTNDSIYVRVYQKSRGQSLKDAKARAEKIQYSFSQRDSSLIFDPFFAITKDDKWRKQSVKIELLLPEGKSVSLGSKSHKILFDIDNISNTWDRDMSDKVWRMEAKGLTCISCEV